MMGASLGSPLSCIDRPLSASSVPLSNAGSVMAGVSESGQCLQMKSSSGFLAKCRMCNECIA